MKSLNDLKAEHSDIVRSLEPDVLEEQRINRELTEKQAKLQAEFESQQQMANALLAPIQKRKNDNIRRKTELEGILKYLEQNEAATEPPKETP